MLEMDNNQKIIEEYIDISEPETIVHVYDNADEIIAIIPCLEGK